MSRTVFISYSKHDSKWKDRLRRFLEPLELWDGAEIWSDDRINAGADWYPEIKEAIGRSAVAVLLITTDYLGTAFIAKQEIPDLLQRRELIGMKVIPLLVHDCPWGRVRWLSQIQMLPHEGLPLDTMSEPDMNTLLSRLGEEIGAHLDAWDNQHIEEGYADERPTAREDQEPEMTPADIEVRVEVAQLPRTGFSLFGRDEQLGRIDEVWDDPRVGVAAFVAWGGFGKSALVNRWLYEMERDHWRGARRVFGWSFFSQGTRDQIASADLFLDQALRFFDDPDPTKGSSADRGERLAHLIFEAPTLLILDGLEPLQSAHKYDKGLLTDMGVQSLLRILARTAGSHFLCLISTREPLADLLDCEGQPYPGFLTENLEYLSPEAGRSLLRHRRVYGDDETLELLARQFGPHALTVSLLGAWLYEKPGHQAEEAVGIPAGDDPFQRVIAAFEMLVGAGPEWKLLRLQGFFDRPATSELLSVLAGESPIKGLTDNLPQLGKNEMDRVSSEQGYWGPWHTAIQRLRELHLLAEYSRYEPNVAEAHPLIREYFAEQLQAECPNLWKAGHRRLFEHLCKVTTHQPDNLEDLQPLYQAVTHGCNAGLQQEALNDVFFERILRGEGPGGEFSWKHLGAVGADLGAIACFFDKQWTDLSPNLTESDQAFLLGEAALRLRALGQLRDAVKPMRAGLKMRILQENWVQASTAASNLSELNLTLGEVSDAVVGGKRSVEFADKNTDERSKIIKRTTYANALHYAGLRERARHLFEESEAMQAEREPKYPWLYSLQGFEYCDLLLSDSEREAWRATLRYTDISNHHETCDEISERAAKTLNWAISQNILMPIANDHLTLARATLYRILLTSTEVPNSELDEHMTAAVDGLRQARAMNHLPRSLLTRAWVRFRSRDEVGGRADLDEVEKIAEQGPMPLFLADVYLHRARLSRDRHELERARKLLEKLHAKGYHRRDEELDDALAAAEKWSYI